MISTHLPVVSIDLPVVSTCLPVVYHSFLVFSTCLLVDSHFSAFIYLGVLTLAQNA